MNRELIYSKVFALVSAIPGFVVKSRRLKHWADVEPCDQPALFMIQKKEIAVSPIKMSTKWTLHAEIYLYANTGGDEKAVVSSILNPLTDAVHALFTPNQAGCEQTLDNLVEKCRIEGAIETDEGVLGYQGVVIIPITIYLAS